MFKLYEKWKLKKEADEKLRQALVKAMKIDDALLEEELKDLPEHQFSEKFERNMAQLLGRKA